MRVLCSAEWLCLSEAVFEFVNCEKKMIENGLICSCPIYF